MTHTYAQLGVSQPVYDEIKEALRKADYGHTFMPDGTIDMHGIGVVLDPDIEAREVVTIEARHAPRGTDAQIAIERERTAAAIDGAMAFGYQNTNPPPEGHELAPWWKRGREAGRAMAIADQAMFETVMTEGRTVYGERAGMVLGWRRPSGVGLDAFDQAVAWLQPRGHVELGKDEAGEFIRVLRRPGK